VIGNIAGNQIHFVWFHSLLAVAHKRVGQQTKLPSSGTVLGCIWSVGDTVWHYFSVSIFLWQCSPLSYIVGMPGICLLLFRINTVLGRHVVPCGHTPLYGAVPILPCQHSLYWLPWYRRLHCVLVCWPSLAQRSSDSDCTGMSRGATTTNGEGV